MIFGRIRLLFYLYLISLVYLQEKEIINIKRKREGVSRRTGSDKLTSKKKGDFLEYFSS